MSIALFAVPDVLTPLHGLWRRFMPTTTQHQNAHVNVDKRIHDFATHPTANHAHVTETELHNTSNLLPHKPLKIVRILETGQHPALVGRMMMSGRMADVCAELDRLVAWEQTLH